MGSNLAINVDNHLKHHHPKSSAGSFTTQVNNMCWWGGHKPADQQGLSFALALTRAPTLRCFFPCSLLWKAPLHTCCLPARWVPASHQCSHREQKPHQTELKSGVQIPTWRKDPADSGGVTAALRWAPAPGDSWQGAESGRCCSARPLASSGETCWHGWWDQQAADAEGGSAVSCYRGAMGSRRKGLLERTTPKLAESRLAQLPMPHSVQTTPEQHHWK